MLDQYWLVFHGIPLDFFLRRDMEGLISFQHGDVNLRIGPSAKKKRFSKDAPGMTVKRLLGIS